MRLNWKAGILVFAGAALAIIATNQVRLNVYLTQAMKHRDVKALAYYRYGVMPDSLVLDIREVGPENSAAATLGGLIAFADSLSDREFREVVLAWRGKARFILDGDDFREMGIEAPYQNPVYTIRTLPEKLSRPDGRPAFSRWTGGMIGVLGAQMEDVNDFARQWYMTDALDRF